MTIPDPTTCTGETTIATVNLADEPMQGTPSITALTGYEHARTALAQCASVDEAKSIRDKAEALRAYGQQANDFELEIWAAEIKTRALRCIGEISSRLDKAKRGGSKNGKRGGGIVLPPSGSTKAEMIRAAGLSLQTAHRCEKIAAMPSEAFEAIINEKKARQEPVTAKDVIREVAKAMKKKSSRPGVAELAKDHPPQDSRDASGIGVIQAKQALNCLKEIPIDDPSRETGFQIILDWIEANR